MCKLGGCALVVVFLGGNNGERKCTLRMGGDLVGSGSGIPFAEDH